MTRRLLFVHNHLTSFVQADLALLRERYDVREWYQRTRQVNFVALAGAVRENDLVFGWFASWHTLSPVWFARLLKRPSVLVVGGYDTANLPEIGYGSQRGGLRRLVAGTAMRQAGTLITNSCFTRNEVIENVGIEPAHVTVIYHGLEAADDPASETKEDLAVTVGSVDQANLKRKGLEPFVRSAACLPQLSFVLIGNWRDHSINYLRSIAPSNVRFAGRVTDRQLHDYLARARVYVQASLHEGFGLSVAEAMLARCVPVVTRAGALPEVVGEAGVYVESAEPEALANGIREAFKLDAKWGERARARVMREFPLSRRRKGLFSVIENSLGGHGRIPFS
jgi:glycosyltransferase involved in cell wall biosynthesis